MLRKNRSEFSVAILNFEKVIERSPLSKAAFKAGIELADLYNAQGLTGKTLQLMQPLLASAVEEYKSSAQMKSGDAEYLQNNFEAALDYYERTIDPDIETSLKKAWMLEQLERSEEAINEYLKISKRGDLESTQATIRAAVLLTNEEKWETSAKLWAKLITYPEDNQVDSRTWYEYLNASSKAGIDHLIPDTAYFRINRTDPLIDEIALLTYTHLISKAAEDQKTLFPEPEDYFKFFSASPFLHKANVEREFYINNKRQSADLMEKMAALYSRQPGEVNQSRWALDWGDFYLYDLKDPHKALDQYIRVLDNYLASAEEIDYALHQRTYAYITLLKRAIHQRDEYDIGMYSDSSKANLINYVNLTVDSTKTVTLLEEFLATLLTIENSNEEKTATILETGKTLNENYGWRAFQVETVISYAGFLLNESRLDSLQLKTLAGELTSRSIITGDLHHRAELMRLAVECVTASGDDSSAFDFAINAKNEFAKTSIDGWFLYWLSIQERTAFEDRLSYLREYESKYPYLVDTYEIEMLYAELFSLNDNKLEALAAKKRAMVSERYSLPAIDILNISTADEYFQEGKAYYEISNLIDAKKNLQIFLNFKTVSKSIVEAYFILADIDCHEGSFETALSYADSAESLHPTAELTSKLSRLKTQIYMKLEDYNQALSGWRALAASDTTEDNLILYRENLIVCLYRLGLLQEARTEARQLYKDCKKRPGLDDMKARFYLEKGNYFARMKNWEEAEKQYITVEKNFSQSMWIDDAAYFAALALIHQNKLVEGSDQLVKFAENYPDSLLADDALIQAGINYYKREKYSEASVTLKRVWNDSSASRHWLTAFSKLISVYNDMRFYDAGIRLTRDYLDRFPATEDLVRRKMYIGWAHLQLGEWDDAIRHYTSLFPLAEAETEAEAQYYVGEAYMGNSEYRTAILEFLKVKILGRKTKLDWGVTALYQAGVCYEKLDEKEGAARMYQRIIKEQGETSNFGMAAAKKLEALGID